METEIRTSESTLLREVTVYLDKDRRVVDGDDPNVAHARRTHFDGGVLVKVEFLSVRPAAWSTSAIRPGR